VQGLSNIVVTPLFNNGVSFFPEKIVVLSCVEKSTRLQLLFLPFVRGGSRWGRIAKWLMNCDVALYKR
jgi:hypothetical protein